MKATKILGAVLGVLMVAALFTGAGAAATVTTEDNALPIDPTDPAFIGPVVGGTIDGLITAMAIADSNNEVYLGDVYAYGLYGGLPSLLNEWPLMYFVVNTTLNETGVYVGNETKDFLNLTLGLAAYSKLADTLSDIEQAIFSTQWTSKDGSKTVTPTKDMMTIKIPLPNPDDYKGDAKKFITLYRQFLEDQFGIPTSWEEYRLTVSRYTFLTTPEQDGEYYCYAKGKKYWINLKSPSVPISGYVYKDSLYSTPVASLIDGSVDINDDMMRITAGELNNGGTLSTLASIVRNLITLDSDGIGMSADGIVFTNPAGSLTTVNIPGVEPTSGSTSTDLSFRDLSNLDLGEWTVQAYFKPDGVAWSTLAPGKMILGKTYTFTAVDSDKTKTITASTDKLTQGGYVTVTVKAPYGQYVVAVDGKAGEIPEGQPDVLDIYDTEEVFTDYGAAALIDVDTTGTASVVIKSLTTDDLKITLIDPTASNKVVKKITVRVIPGAITATASKDKVYIGDEFDVSGTNDLGGTVNFFVKGTNYKLTAIYENPDGTTVSDKQPVVASGNIWKKTLDSAKFRAGDKKRPDAGTYTIYIAKLATGKYFKNIERDIDVALIEELGTEAFDNENLVEAYTTISVALIQPFITVDVPDVVVQGDKLEITGTAEGNPTQVGIYVFGTNFFKATSTAVLSDDATYSFSKKVVGSEDDATTAWNMAAGQYFVVVQHPMYDGVFNVVATADSTGSIYKDEADGWSTPVVADPTKGHSSSYKIFDTTQKQSANAAYALEVAIADENIDDMQAHKSFIVKAPESDVNAVPSQVQQGQKLVISGVTAGHTNEMVSVELLSTAFAATSKEAAGSAAFATLTTRIGEDGKWTVTFDTTNMNCDDYTVSIAVGQLDPVTAKTKIVKADTPVTPTTPTTKPTVSPSAKPTTTPKTPGFGALAALVGLGAVAVLLLRRE